jgi:RNA polymerase sigma-70 factor (ECF subfamily)
LWGFSRKFSDPIEPVEAARARKHTMTSASPDTSFAEALLAQTSWLRGLVRTLIGDTARIDDVCQATLLEAWRYKPRHGSGLRPWLARVARRLSGHLARRERQRPDREAQAARPDNEPSTADVVEQVAWQETVVRAVMALNEPYRTTILRRFWEDVPPSEVARRMGVPIETVRTRLKRGLAMLRERLDRECGNRQTWVTALIPLARYEGALLPLKAAILMSLMSKKTASLAAVVVAGLAMTYFMWPDPANRPPDLTNPLSSSAITVAKAPAIEPLDEMNNGELERLALEPGPRITAGPLDDDPVIAAAMCGFRGRTVSSSGEPIADCTVRIYRHSFDRLAAPGVDLLRDRGNGPGLAESTASTDRDGEFLISGVWPRGMYFLVADGGTHGRVLRLVDRAPDPGQVVDLGDVRLDADGVVTGTVVDAGGRPVDGALVRALDLPGALFDAAPIESFDPDGAILLREPFLGVAPVIEVPSWARDLYEQLPIPSAHTGNDGRFRLTGVRIGENAVLIGKPDLQPVVKRPVVVDRGSDRDLGQIRMSEGRLVLGRVVDTPGSTVAGAQVLVASASGLAPVDFARRVADTDHDGRFSAAGFPPGPVRVAVRRSENHAWTVTGPTPATDEIVVTLEELCELEIEVTSANGQPIESLALEIFPGPLTRQSIAFRMIGLQDPIALDGRVQRVSASQWTVTGLEPGPYLVAASSDGHGRSLHAVELPRSGALAMELDAETVQEVLVTDASGSPIRNAEVFVEPDGSRDMADHPLPTNSGRTDRSGRLEVRHASYDQVRITALHPTYGVATVVVFSDDREVNVTMEQPGSIDGRVLEKGSAPPPGRYSVMLRRREGTSRSVIEESPVIVDVRAEGTFNFGSLQPGWYELTAIDAPSIASSLGGLLDTVSRWNRAPDRTVSVQVRAGEPTEVRIPIGGEPVLAEATARLTGSVFVNGQPQPGMRVRLRDLDGDDVAEVHTDAAGAFDSGPIQGGEYRLSIYAASDAEHALFARMVELDEHETEHLNTSIGTASIAGEVVGMGGVPISGADIDIIRASIEGPGVLHFRARSDSRGLFSMALLPTGPYQVRAMHTDPPLFAPVQKIEIVPGGPRTDLRLSMRSSFDIRGSLDRASYGLTDAGQLSVRLRREDTLTEDVRVMLMVARTELASDDTFEFLGIGAGTYLIQVETDSGHFLWNRVPIEVVDKVVDIELDLVDRQ